MCAHQQAIAYKRWARYIIVGKNAQCKADEQFHFANKNGVRSINNKNKKQVKTKKEKERKKQTTITKHKNTNSR